MASPGGPPEIQPNPLRFVHASSELPFVYGFLRLSPPQHTPSLYVHVYGTDGTGKERLKKLWLNSSDHQPLSLISDVHFSIEEDGIDPESYQLPVLKTEPVARQHVFLVIYQSDDQESVKYAQQSLQKLNSYYHRLSPLIIVLSNHSASGYTPQSTDPSQLPPWLSEGVQIPCKFLDVQLEDVSGERVVEQVVVNPVIDQLDENVKSQIIAEACTQGHLRILQLLSGRLEESDSVKWITIVMNSLRDQPPDSSISFNLLKLADYLHNLDSTIFLSTVVRMTKTHPHISLQLLNRYRPQGQSEDHFTKSGLALYSIPTSWFQNRNFTYIDLSNNLLLDLPEEVFRISTLKGLNISHNCLGSVPNILKWNCPYLRELNISFNRLVDAKYSILNRPQPPRNRQDDRMPSKGAPDRADQQTHYEEARRLYNLTGYNLYPCLHSLNWVNLSSNASLTQVPEWVCLLPNLTLLELKNIPKLVSLTPYLAHCRNLCILKIDIHHLVSPPAREVANSGTRGIMAYLRCQLRGSSPYRHLKLVLVGADGTGKTTLFSQLAKLKSNLFTSSHSSSSLSQLPRSSMELHIATIDYRGSSREDGRKQQRPKITYHLVDFTSENVFQNFHQCFITHRTLFLCLWDVTKGVESLGALRPWLRSIQASAPGSSVLVIGSHIDQRPGLGKPTVAEWQREVFGESRRGGGGGGVGGGERGRDGIVPGLPIMSDFIVMNCQNKRDVEKLMQNIYRISLRLKHPRNRTPLVEEMVPQSYQELQTLVEVKLRGFQRKGQQVPVLRREEFIDHVRSLTLHHENLEEDEEEFTLAVQFLHEAGTIIHHRPRVGGVSELFFLSPQWLFNALGVILVQLSSLSHLSMVTSSQLPFAFQKAGIPPHFYTHFLGLLEENNVVVPLDMDKNQFLIPSVLEPNPPEHYPGYDLSDEGRYQVQYVHMDYIPSGFFPRLLARVLVCIGMLSGQLLALGRAPLITNNHPRQTASLQPMSRGGVDMLGGTVRRRIRLDTRGYIRDEDEVGESFTTLQKLRHKIWALSTTNLATWPSRHQSLMEKLNTLSRTISRHEPPPTLSFGGGRRENGVGQVYQDSEEEEEEEEGERGGRRDGLVEGVEHVVWKNGLHVEFPCGTCFWLEACEGAVVMVCKGDLVQRVKVVTFLSACVDMLMEELYTGIGLVYYSPCPSCLSRYWSNSSEATLPSLPERELELLSSENSLILNEFKGTASYTNRKNSTDQEPTPRRFSGTKMNLERSLSPVSGTEETFTSINAVGEIIEEVPCVILDNNIILYSLSSLVEKSSRRSSVQCSKCERVVPLKDIGPHVLLADFSDKLLISSRKLLYGDGKGALLGDGSFGKVVKGTYDGHPVAVKLFKKQSTSESVARQYKSLREEVTVLSHLNHPRVVRLMGVCLRPLCLVMDLAPQGSLRNHLDLCPLGLSHSMAHQTLYQVADGISYLHSLYIVHRDIKPGNILVWSLDPEKGVDVKLADYGVSQFSTPSGLWKQGGTEEYMAPELRASSHNSSYDEKVDIFSFALLLHLVVTGRKLFAGVLNRRHQLQMIYHSDLPLLSHALAKSIEENRPQTSDPTLRHVFEGKHPAGRRNIDASCHSVCMQPLLEHCLSHNPASRPSAHGIASRLLVCPGGLRQSRFFISSAVSWAGYCPQENHIVALTTDSDDKAILVIPGAWLYRQKSLPYQDQQITCCAIVKGEVLMGSAASNLIFSLKLPSLTSGHISPVLLPGAPLCIIPVETSQGSKVVVGMSAARIAIFSPPGQGRHLLETHPFITQVVPDKNPERSKVTCGVHHGGVVWCGCGRHLIGLDSRDHSVKTYQPMSTDVDYSIWRMVCALGCLWVSFFRRTELVIFDTSSKTVIPQPVDCHLILGSCLSSEASITDLVTTGETIWAATEGGHVLTFDPISGDVLLVHCRCSHTSSLVCVGTDQVVVFGRERVEGVEGAEDEEKHVFTVWDSYIKYRVT